METRSEVRGDAAHESSTMVIRSHIIGKVSEYSLNEDFEVYLERLEQYVLANMVEDDRKGSVFLTVISPEVYRILRDLCDPVLPKDRSYEELCALLRKQFAPQLSVFRKRIEFYESKQSFNETISEWYVRIKNLAIPCKFGAVLEGNLKDRFVTGLRRGPVLDRLCEDGQEKTLTELVDIALQKEASLKQQINAVVQDMNKMTVKGKVYKKKEQPRNEKKKKS
ncbi:hypothetical protein ILUMI_13345 [Ignelater luminosus]|uniref:Uncharacterized protein n=1 Tax=Ignelater luminosus TaxID=2038154 RepID=A0A8K0G8R5_IGNLU|nr:hypothetical protein ILUMI_13345 [Ignelater luminosus]